MELNDLKIDDLKNKQIVIVELTHHVLTFLVKDIEHPQVPGYPACSLSYYDNIDLAKDAIYKKYRELDFFPKSGSIKIFS